MPNFVLLSVSEWIEKTNAIGIIGRKENTVAGTYAHKDIAFEFGSAISVPFKLYLITEFQATLKKKNKNNWVGQPNGNFVKLNYHIHTDAIKHNLIPKNFRHNRHQLFTPTKQMC